MQLIKWIYENHMKNEWCQHRSETKWEREEKPTRNRSNSKSLISFHATNNIPMLKTIWLPIYICVVCFKYCIFNILGGHENTAVSKGTYCLVISLGEAVTNHNAFIDETAIVLIGIRKFYQSYWSLIRPFFRLVQIGL